MKDFKFLFLSIAAFITIVLSSFTSYKSESANMPPSGGNLVNFDTVNLFLGNCSASGKVCLPIKLGDAIKLKITDNGVPLPVDFMNGCDFDTTSAYTYSNLFGVGNAGPYILTSWNVNNQSFTDTFDNITQLVDLMNGWDPMGNWVLNPTNLLISGGNSANSYDTMQVWVTVLQSPSFIGYNLGITPNGTELSFTRGFHEVILEDTINNISDTFYVHAYCSETITHQVGVAVVGTDCLPTTDLLTAPASISWCSGTSPSNNAVGFGLDDVQFCVTYSTFEAGSASGCIILCDSTGFCDTTYINVGVTEPNNVQQVNLIIEPGDVQSYCFDSTNTSGTIISLTSCGASTNGFASYALDTVNNCVTITGTQEGGTDFGCVIVCNHLGNCDTTYFTTVVRRIGPDVYFDTININQSGNYCVDQYLVDSINAFTAILEPAGNLLDYTLNDSSYCVQFTGLAIGTDTLGLVINNIAGQADTSWIILTVLPPSPQVIIDTLDEGQSGNYCLSVAELGGSIFTVTNLCPAAQNGEVAFTLDTVSLCLQYTALSAGADSACYIVCDNLGTCDTFVFIITAIDTITNLLPPTANSDATLTDAGTPITISVLNNDQIPGGMVGTVMILNVNPNGTTTSGTVQYDSINQIITYTPANGFCDSTDMFTYLICNAVGCDTATVTIMVFCADEQLELEFYEGFSPNDDDVNDTFVIKNVDLYPGNELKVFNRWGAQVFFDKNYRNDWKGTWKEEPLPDGVYFYVLDNGKGDIHSGHVTIRR